MRRVLILLSMATVAALAVLTAPALSSRPYQPEPVVAEVEAPADERGPASATGVVSAPIRAPIRFNTVGMDWSGNADPAIAVRVRGEREDWGPWTPVPGHPDGGPDPGTGEGTAAGASPPVWAGEADYLQYRLSRSPRDLTLHFINTTGTATATDRVETTLRGVVNEATVAVAGLAAAEAGDPVPEMVTRREWSGGQCRPRDDPAMGRVRAAFVHHTVTANGYSREQAAPMVLGICEYHRYAQGWDDIGYPFLVDRFGRLYEGRAGGVDRPLVGAHVQGFNDESTGVASLGTYSSQRQSRRAMRATARLLRWKLPLHDAPTRGKVTLTSGGGELNPYARGQEVSLNRISGHRDAGSTDCPGSRLYGQLRRLRRMSDVTPPAAPTALRAAGRTRAVKLDWRRNDDRDLKAYRVYRAGGDDAFERIASTRESELRDRRLRPGRTYTYHVRAVDAAGNLSRPSSEASATVRG